MIIDLPVAEMAVSFEWIFLVSIFAGVLSGIFGIGGGFIMTPFLIFIGIPPAIAVGTQATQLTASSLSGVVGYWRRRSVDVRVGGVMLVGGTIGAITGMFIFKLLKLFGHIDFAISLAYIILLGVIGSLMLFKTITALLLKGKSVRKEFNTFKVHSFVVSLPLKMRFPRSELYISALVPIGIGFIGGVLATILGIGGGFILVPAMIYILGIPAVFVTGTSLFQIVFTAAFAASLHGLISHTVDPLLAAILISGSVIGAQFGVLAARYIHGPPARIALGCMILAVCISLLVRLFYVPI